MTQTILDRWLRATSQKITYGKIKSNDFIYVGDWTCKAENDLSILGEKAISIEDSYYVLSNDAILIVDPGMLKKNLIEFMSFKHSQGTSEHTYKIFKTGVAGMSDYTIIGNFIIIDPAPLSNILCAANHLIKEDMNDAGPLFNLSNDDGQENINLGYYCGEHGQLKMVFLERKKPVKNLVREYHLHESPVPRDFYKIKRHFLIEG